MAERRGAQEIWQATLAELQWQMARGTFDTWLRPTTGVALDDGRLTVGVANEETRAFLVRRFDRTAAEVVSRVAGEAMTCDFVVASPGNVSRGNGAALTQEALPFGKPGLGGPPSGLRLNPRYVFDTFVVGAGNRLAHAAAQAVAEHPAGRYNPLFIYGGAGLGKTHLLHAIGHAVHARGADVRGVSSEQFTNQLINAIRNTTTEAFRAVYREADVLLVDDIHFIAGKESTQEEFFHTFNAIHDADGQIVMTSDRPPQAIATLEDRLRSRFQWGLLVDIEPPDLETRIAILRAKTEHQGHAVADTVLELIAQAIQHNIRELEGALHRVVMYAQCNHVTLTPDAARKALADYLMRREPPPLARVVQVVAAFYGLDEAELLGRSRSARVSEPRQVAMYLMREESAASYPAIGAALGGRDHTTILHGWEKISRLIEQDAKLRRNVMQLRERLYAA